MKLTDVLRLRGDAKLFAQTIGTARAELGVLGRATAGDLAPSLRGIADDLARAEGIYGQRLGATGSPVTGLLRDADAAPSVVRTWDKTNLTMLQYSRASVLDALAAVSHGSKTAAARHMKHSAKALAHVEERAARMVDLTSQAAAPRVRNAAVAGGIGAAAAGAGLTAWAVSRGGGDTVEMAPGPISGSPIERGPISKGAREVIEGSKSPVDDSGLVRGEDYIVGINGQAPNGGVIPLSDRAREYFEEH